MARAGRKRKPAVARTPKGRISTAGKTSRTESATAVVRAYRIARGATPGKELDQRYGYELGRLMLDGKLDRDDHKADRMHRAGQELGRLAARFYRAAEITKPTPKCANMEGGGGGESFMTAEQRQSASRQYHEAVRSIPRESLTAVWSLVILDTADTPDMLLPRIRAGLTALASHLLGRS